MSTPEQILDTIKWGAMIASSPVIATLTYRALRQAYDDVYQRMNARRHDRLTLQHLDTQNRLHDIREIRADERGRYPLLYGEGGILRDPNNLRAFTLTSVRETWPGIEQLDWAVKTLIAMQGVPAGSARQVDQFATAAVPPAWPDVVDLVARYRDRVPSLDHLLVGVTVDPDGQQREVTTSLHDLMHTLVAGASGWGKSTWLRALLWQLARCPEPVEVLAIDPSGSEFNILGEWPRLRYPVARTIGDAIAQMRAVSGEIARRRQLYATHPLVTKLDEYNRVADRSLAPWVVALDEGAYYLHQAGTREPLREAVWTARQYGIYILIAVVTAKADTFKSDIRDQFSSRICHHTSASSSRVVLDDAAAGELNVRGRSYAQLLGRDLVQIQSPYVSREDFYRAVRGGRPRYSMPAAPPASLDDTAASVLDLHAQGLTPSAICFQIHGYSNGTRVREIQQILAEHDDDIRDVVAQTTAPVRDTVSSSS